MYLTGDATEFDELTRWLHGLAPLWRERPFVRLRASWETEYPALSEALRALPEETVERYDSTPEALALPDPFPRWVREAAERTRWAPLAPVYGPTAEPRPRGVPGRKWEQISRLAAALSNRIPPGLQSWVDWCSGKGHLGGLLARTTGQPVCCVEYDPKLRTSGAEQAARPEQDGDVRFRELDALRADLGEFLQPQTGVVALHACGQLHANLIEQACRSSNRFLAVAPCCYHRFGPVAYTPLSAHVRNHPQPLALERDQLRLVGFEQPISSGRRKAQRRRENAWRLAVEGLLTEVSGGAGDERSGDGYHLGPLPRAWFELDFEEFCRNMAARAQRELPAGTDFPRWEALGYERSRAARALGLVRGLFRRPLESWLVLDRCLRLKEAGYAVTVGTFCEPDVTPRNLLVVARRDA